jgi:hypothetical protein
MHLWKNMKTLDLRLDEHPLEQLERLMRQSGFFFAEEYPDWEEIRSAVSGAYGIKDWGDFLSDCENERMSARVFLHLIAQYADRRRDVGGWNRDTCCLGDSMPFVGNEFPQPWSPKLTGMPKEKLEFLKCLSPGLRSFLVELIVLCYDLSLLYRFYGRGKKEDEKRKKSYARAMEENKTNIRGFNKLIRILLGVNDQQRKKSIEYLTDAQARALKGAYHFSGEYRERFPMSFDELYELLVDEDIALETKMEMDEMLRELLFQARMENEYLHYWSMSPYTIAVLQPAGILPDGKLFHDQLRFIIANMLIEHIGEEHALLTLHRLVEDRERDESLIRGIAPTLSLAVVLKTKDDERTLHEVLEYFEQKNPVGQSVLNLRKALAKFQERESGYYETVLKHKKTI